MTTPTPEISREQIQELAEAFATLADTKREMLASNFRVEQIRLHEISEDRVTSLVAASGRKLCTLALEALDMREKVKALLVSIRQAQKDKCNGFDTLASAEWDNITRLANELRDTLKALEPE